MSQADIAVIGLAVMGQNLVLNMADNGHSVSVYNRTHKVTEDFVNDRVEERSIQGFDNYKNLIGSLSTPRKVLILVKAGSPVDATIEEILPYMDKGDVIIDNGNSNFDDTSRRYEYLKEKGFLFVGAGISGGEEGARHGPSMMPGGDKRAWPLIKDIFQSVAAKSNGEACCEWVGNSGAGHYVKMVHNGIEYGDMQLICESYQIMQEGLGLGNQEIADIFADWNTGALDSYLIEITKNILAFKDEDGSFLVDNIKDKAGQKGTGKWTVLSSLDLAAPVTLISEAVYARVMSSMFDERQRASKQIVAQDKKIKPENVKSFVEAISKALFASKIASYAQGYMLMLRASKENNWELDFGAIALMWRGGCIIRSRFLDNIKEAFETNPDLESLLLDEYFKKIMSDCESSWREVIAEAIKAGIPVPAMSSAIAFFDSYRRAKLPHNLLQAQRDYFGAHTYERLDRPDGERFHTNWTGSGGKVASGEYNA